jgi:hypothetical protein
MNCNFIFCFRAKNSVKPVKVQQPGGGFKTEVVPQGFVPIAGDDFVFEMTVNALLLPGADGLPTWQSENVGERTMIKLPQQFRGLMDRPRQFDEKMGAAFARWAKGGAAPVAETSAGRPPPPAEDPEPDEADVDGEDDEAPGGFGVTPAEDGEPSATILWARGVQEDLEGDAWRTVAELDAFTTDPDSIAMFTALQAEDQAYATRLDAAFRGRRKALATRGG